MALVDIESHLFSCMLHAPAVTRQILCAVHMSGFYNACRSNLVVDDCPRTALGSVMACRCQGHDNKSLASELSEICKLELYSRTYFKGES